MFGTAVAFALAGLPVPATAFPGWHARGGTIVAATGRDTVWIVALGGTRTLEWFTSTASGRRAVRWRSRPLGSFEPRVVLRPIAGTSQPDLFWSIDDEQTAAAMLVVAAGDGARVAFTSPVGASCRVPELQDVTGDGLPDVVAYRPGALSAEECRGDALATPCAQAYGTEWAEVYVQQRGGQFVQDPRAARAYYRDAATRYARDAASLRRAIRTHTGVAAASPRCDAGLAAGLERLARHASRLADAR